MELDATFRPFVVAIFLLIIGIAVPFRVRSQSTGESLDRMQEGPITMIGLRVSGLVLWMSIFAFMFRPASIAWASLPFPAAVRWAGIGIAIVSAGLLFWTLRSLGRNLTDTVVTRREHSLVMRGPYRYVRHPFYDCMILMTLGTSLATANWFVLLSGAVTFAFLAYRSRTEEEKLLERFGEPYRAYRATTGRFIPGIGRVRTTT